MNISIRFRCEILSRYNGIMTVAIYATFGNGEERLITIFTGNEGELREKLKEWIDDSA